MTTFIDENSVDRRLLVVLLRGPNTRRLLKHVFKVPQAHNLLRDSAEFVVLSVQDYLLVVLGLPPEQQLFRNQIVLPNYRVHLDQHEVAFGLTGHLDELDLGFVAQEGQLIIVHLNSL